MNYVLFAILSTGITWNCFEPFEWGHAELPPPPHFSAECLPGRVRKMERVPIGSRYYYVVTVDQPITPAIFWDSFE